MFFYLRLNRFFFLQNSTEWDQIFSCLFFKKKNQSFNFYQKFEEINF